MCTKLGRLESGGLNYHPRQGEGAFCRQKSKKMEIEIG